MTTSRGVFIAIEGTDGSGKGTQCKHLVARLKREGYDVAAFDFPQYNQPSSFFVQQYLNGKYGTATEVGPYTASLFYALDRYEAAPRIREALEQGKVVIANRFVGSNMAHQGTKFQHAEERRGFFIWLDNLEFEMLRIPRPALSLVLRVPAETAQHLVDQKEQRSYTDQKRDLHEADLAHLKRSVEVYDDMCQLFPTDFARIDCTRDDQLIGVTAIHDIIWQKIEPLLPARKKNNKTAPAAVVPTPTVAESAYVNKKPNGTYELTTEGKKLLDETVTSLDGNVYAFTHKMSHTAVVAAMAHAVRTGDDLRTTILDTVIDTLDKDHHLQQRVIETYGEGAIRELTGMHIVIEQASSILAGLVEQGRLPAFLDRATRYVAYDQKDANGNYRYYTPDYLEPRLHEQYRAYMDQIFNLYAEIVSGVTGHLQRHTQVPKELQDSSWLHALKTEARDMVRPVLPVAAKTAIGIYASGQALETVIMRLMSGTLPEGQKAGEAILLQARKVAPAFMERVATPERGGAAITYRATTHKKMSRLAREYLPDQYADATPPVTLVDVCPRNELDLVPDMLYKYSTLPLKALQGHVDGWPYDKKVTVFETYLGERTNHHQQPGRALEKARYSWDLLCDYGTFRELQRHRIVDALEGQELTPRYGYEVPKLVEEAELADQFEACFDLSLRLHSLLQEAGYAHEAQYATLHGHKMRTKVTYNAREAFRMHTSGPSPQGNSASYRQLMQAMYTAISEAHPILGEALRSGEPKLDAPQT
jgi:thymidylate kinase/thymidylate synthase ThyX